MRVQRKAMYPAARTMALAMMWFWTAGVCRGATSDQFSLRLEAGASIGDQREVVVVGSWTRDGIQGWQVGICHDPAEVSIGGCSPAWYRGCGELAACPSVKCTSDLLTAQNGTPPDYLSFEICADGICQAVVIDLNTSVTLRATARFELLRITYVLHAPAAALDFCDSLPCGSGDAPMVTSFVADGRFHVPEKQDGIMLTSPLNGDVNASGLIDIADAVYLLSYLFAQGPAPAPIQSARCDACCTPCPPPSLPATGQTMCYTVFPPLMRVDCADVDYPGEDAFYQAGCPKEGRFVDNGDGTVTDNCTGLMWQRETAPLKHSWWSALMYCENLELAGRDDWRLPNIREIHSIADYGRSCPSIDPVFETQCSIEDQDAGPYWSSTTKEPDFDRAFYVPFRDATIGAGEKLMQYYVRAVRG